MKKLFSLLALLAMIAPLSLSIGCEGDEPVYEEDVYEEGIGEEELGEEELGDVEEVEEID